MATTYSFRRRLILKTRPRADYARSWILRGKFAYLPLQLGPRRRSIHDHEYLDIFSEFSAPKKSRPSGNMGFPRGRDLLSADFLIVECAIVDWISMIGRAPEYNIIFKYENITVDLNRCGNSLYILFYLL